MPKIHLGADVFANSLDRVMHAYEGGHRVVVSFSGGKDSTVIMELCLIAARETGNLPLDVVMRDDEILLPGTFEYCERVADRDEVNFHWIYACQPVLNIYSRETPYYWAFDPALSPDQWMRSPPPFAEQIQKPHIEAISTPERFPPPDGAELIVMTGLRTQESSNRLMGIHSSKGWLTKLDKRGVRKGRPVFDWTESDVWKFIRDLRLEYSPVYDDMVRYGIPVRKMRVAPPAMSTSSVPALKMARNTYPQWFARLCDRLPGVREAAMYGKAAFQPVRRTGEDWHATFVRTCIDEAPEWIAARAKILYDRAQRYHAKHSTKPLADIVVCNRCGGASWKFLTERMYLGDPFRTTLGRWIPTYVQPEQFREGAGTWQGGTPSW